MEQLEIRHTQWAMQNLLNRVHSLVQYDQLAEAYFLCHVRSAKSYLRRSALLMGGSIACSAWVVLGGPILLTVPAMAIPLGLLALRVDRKISFHLMASAEYRLSMAEFENAQGPDWIPKSIETFEKRCLTYGPENPPLTRLLKTRGFYQQNEKLIQYPLGTE